MELKSKRERGRRDMEERCGKGEVLKQCHRDITAIEW